MKASFRWNDGGGWGQAFARNGKEAVGIATHFSGVTVIFDVKPCLKGGAFKALEDKGYFSQARPAHYGIAWPNRQDFSADTFIWDIQHSKEETA